MHILSMMSIYPVNIYRNIGDEYYVTGRLALVECMYPSQENISNLQETRYAKGNEEL